jgi:Flp pilus assembly protein TadG
MTGILRRLVTSGPRHPPIAAAAGADEREACSEAATPGRAAAWPGASIRIGLPIPALRRAAALCETRVRRFARHRAGASAVEFALLAGPFLALLVVVAESGLVALEQQTLDIAVDRGVRQLRTGIFQDGADGSDPSQRFRRIVCSGPSILFPCTDLRLDVSRATSFSTSKPAEPFDRTTKTWAAGFGTRFDCPQGGDTVTVRVAVPVMRLFQMLDFTGRIMSDKSQMLVATEIFRAEDYEPKPC